MHEEILDPRPWRSGKFDAGHDCRAQLA